MDKLAREESEAIAGAAEEEIRRWLLKQQITKRLEPEQPECGKAETVSGVPQRGKTPSV